MTRDGRSVTRRIVLALAVTLAAAVPGAASAQSDPSFLAGQSAQMGTTMYLSDMVRRQSGGRAHAMKPAVHAKGRARSKAAASSAAALRYRASAAITRRDLDNFAAQLRAADPADADRFAELARSGAVMANARRYLGRYGLTTGDVADCIALYLASAWLATEGSDADPTRGQMRGLRAQVAEALGADPMFAKASDATKQEVAEANLLQAMVAGESANLARRDAAMREKVRTAIAAGARSTYGLDILSVRLTDAGFAPRQP